MTFMHDDVCTRGTWCLRCGVCGAVLLIIAGFGLTIGGISVLASTNPRTDKVNSYNTLGAKYMSEDFAPFGNLNFSLTLSSSSSPGGSVTLNATQSVAPVDVVGAVDGIKDFKSRTFIVHGVPREALFSSTLSYRSSESAPPVQLSPLIFFAPRTSTQAIGLACTTALCSGPAGDCSCSSDIMRAQCTKLYNGTFTSSNGYCRADNSDETCGTCRYTAYLTGVCVPVVLDPALRSVTTSTQVQSCRYPFASDQGLYDSVSPASTVTVSVKTVSDPEIQLQRLTQGTRYFGFSTMTQVGIGIGLLVPGVVTAIVGAGVTLAVLHSHQQNLMEEEEELERNAAQNPSAGQEMQQIGPQAVAVPLSHPGTHIVVPPGSTQQFQESSAPPPLMPTGFSQQQQAFPGPMTAYPQQSPAMGGAQPAYYYYGGLPGVPQAPGAAAAPMTVMMMPPQDPQGYHQGHAAAAQPAGPKTTVA